MTVFVQDLTAEHRTRQDLFDDGQLIRRRIIGKGFKLQDILLPQEIAGIHIIGYRKFAGGNKAAFHKGIGTGGGIVAARRLAFENLIGGMDDQAAPAGAFRCHRLGPIQAGVVRFKFPIRVLRVQTAEQVDIAFREAGRQKALLIFGKAAGGAGTEARQRNGAYHQRRQQQYGEQTADLKASSSFCAHPVTPSLPKVRMTSSNSAASPSF